MQNVAYHNVGDAIAAVQGGIDPQNIYFAAQGNGALDGALATGIYSTASGGGSTARGDQSTAIGAGTSALGTGSSAFGFNSTAGGANSTAMGINSSASGANSIASGSSSAASGDQSTAMGASSAASGLSSSAFGNNSIASGSNSSAFGQGAVASGRNSTAIGAGASATRDNQVAIGTGASTYTAAGVTSAASRAAQSGSTQFVTTDSNGNLANSAYGPQDIAGLNSNVNNLQSQTNYLSATVMGHSQDISALRSSVQRGYEGTAVALATAGGNFLQENQKFAITGKFGQFRGQTAFGGSAQMRLSNNVVAHAGVGGGVRYGGVGAFGGLTLGW